MITIGINSVYHESAAAIAVNGRLVAAVEEERFNRRKHGKPAEVGNAHLLPIEAIRFCLDQACARPADVDAIAYSFDPAGRAREFHVDALAMPGDWGSNEGEQAFRESLDKVRAAVGIAFGNGWDDRLQWVPHHLAHAASAFYPSGFDEAAVLVVDGIAEDASACMGLPVCA